MDLNFTKNGNDLVPAIIQHYSTRQVLMLGYMNQEALTKTQQERKVTFYSRSKKRLWTKGETSGNFLYVKEILADCDQDTLLIMADPVGPVCHTGQDSCFGSDKHRNFLAVLENIIQDRKENPVPRSYTTALFQKGTARIAQKVGEEAVELIIEAVGQDEELFLGEAADLIYHLLVLLVDKGYTLDSVEEVLERRHKK